MSVVNLSDEEKSVIKCALKIAYIYDEKSCFCILCEASATEDDGDSIVHLDNCQYYTLLRKLEEK